MGYWLVIDAWQRFNYIFNRLLDDDDFASGRQGVEQHLFKLITMIIIIWYMLEKLVEYFFWGSELFCWACMDLTKELKCS